MHRRRLIQGLAFTVAVLASAAAPRLVDAQPLRFDVNSRSTGAQTQSGWTAVNLNNINNVSFSAVGGVLLDDRDRGAGANSAPGSTFDDMWRDFIFADERNVNVGSPAGMDITIANLMPSTLYTVSLWAFDVVSVPTRSMTWNGVAYSFAGTDPRPDGLMEKRVTFSTISDAAGVAVLNGRINEPAAGPCCNVFVNGFTLAEVPEPTSFALFGIGATLLGLRARRRRTA